MEKRGKVNAEALSITGLSMRSADSSTHLWKVFVFLCDYGGHCSPPTFYSHLKEFSTLGAHEGSLWRIDAAI
jgi:hypothetical protein